MAYYNVGPCDCCGGITFCNDPIRANYSIATSGFSLTAGGFSPPVKWCSDDSTAVFASVHPSLIHYPTYTVPATTIFTPAFFGTPPWSVCTTGCSTTGSCQYVQATPGQTDDDDTYDGGFDICESGSVNKLYWLYQMQIIGKTDGVDQYYWVQLQIDMITSRIPPAGSTVGGILRAGFYAELTNPTDLSSITVNFWSWSTGGGWTFPGGATNRTSASYTGFGGGTASAPASITITGVG